MKLADHLTKKEIQQFNQLRKGRRNREKKPDPTPKPKRQENLSQRDWEEIMGTGRDIYKRVNGAVRRR
ncbi:hypothetical protein ACOSZF_19865 [Cytobacillus firmus]|uniref:hypothetical protein n=1 Tax=Cytobacillus firmus TaxID=1399 RepID=UPI003B9ECCB1